MLLDAHAHLDHYEDHLEAVLEEITQHGILTISNSMDLPSYHRNREIGEECELVLPAFGVHPWNARQYAERLQDLSSAIEQSPILGEIGLDFHYVEDVTQYRAQREVFEFFLTAARELKKIVNLHTKGAEKDVLRLLDRYEIHRSIVHWYSGPISVLYQLIDQGSYFTIGVEVLYSEHIQNIAREIPLERILTETDNPGGLRWYTGSLGMPRVVIDVIRALAGLRNVSEEAIVQSVQTNFQQLIEGDQWLSETYSRTIG